MENITEKENTSQEFVNPAQRSRRTKSFGSVDSLQSTQQDPLAVSRTPLQDVNCRERLGDGLLGRIVKRVQYSELTPLSAPTAAKTQARSSKAKKPVLQELGDQTSYSAPVVQYKKLRGAIVEYKQDFEGHLNEKENYIRSLEEKIQQLQATSAPDDLVLTVGHPNDETDPNSATAIHKTPVADHTIGVGYHTLPHVLFKATPEIIGSSAYAGGYTSPLTSANQCLSLDVGTIATSPHPTPLPLKLVDLNSGERRSEAGVTTNSQTSGLSPALKQGTRSVGCSPIKIPVEHYESHSSSSGAPSPDYTVDITDGQIGEDREIKKETNLMGSKDTVLLAGSAEQSQNRENGRDMVSNEKQNSDTCEKCGKLLNVEGHMESEQEIKHDCNSEPNGIVTENVELMADKSKLETDVDIRDDTNKALEESNIRNNESETKDSGSKSVSVKYESAESGVTSAQNVESDNVDENMGQSSAGHSKDLTVNQNVDNCHEERTSYKESINDCVEKNQSCAKDIDSYTCVDESNSKCDLHCISDETRESRDTVSQSVVTSEYSKNTSIQGNTAVTNTVGAVAMQDCGNNTSILLDRTSTATNTDPVTLMNTNTISLQSVTCHTDCIQGVDFNVNTSFNDEVFGGGVLDRCHFKEKNVGNGVSSVAVSTSPSRLNMGRPSEVGLTEMSYDELRLQLETACISNTLLRQELDQKQEQTEKVLKELKSTKEVSSTVESRMIQLERRVKAPLEAQIASLKTQQSQYQTNIQDLEKQLQEKSDIMGRLECKHKQSLEYLKKENATLQTDLKRIYSQKRQEIEALKQEYAQENYKRLYHASQEKVKTLETSLSAFTSLVAIVNDSQKTQMEAQTVLETGHKRLKEKNQQNKEDRQDLEKKLREWEEEKTLAREEVRVTQLQHDSMKQTVDALKQSVEERNKQIEQLKMKLTDYIEKLAGLEQENQAQCSVNRHLTEELNTTRVELARVCDARNKLEQELTEGRKAKQDLEQISNQLTDKLTTVTEEVEKFQEERENLSALKERYESEIASLSSKLQEVSDEHVSKCGEVAVLHREKLEQLNKLSMLQKEEGEAGELKVRLVALQEQLQSLQKSSKESQLFSELEVSTLREALEENKKQCDMLDKMASRSEEEKAELEERLTAESERYSQLQSELDHTKTQAHMMLLEQGSEVSAAVESLNRLSDTLQNFHNQLQHRASLLDEQAEEAGGEVVSVNVTDSEKLEMEGGGRSLLSSVIRAINRGDTSAQGISLQSETEDTSFNGESVDTSLVGEEQVDYTPVEGFLSSNQNETGFEKSSMDCSLSQEAGSEDVTGSLTTRHSGRANDESMSLCEQIETACALLGDVISTAKHLDTLMMGRQDMLSQNIVMLEEALEEERSSFERKLKSKDERLRSLELQLSDVRQIEKEAKFEMNTARLQVGERERELRTSRKLLEEKTAALEARVEQESMLQKSQEEVSRLQRELSERVSEHRVTQESLEDALRALDSVNREETASKNVPTPGAEDRKYARENHFLKTEVSKLRQKLLYASEEGESLANKANHRLKIMQHNVTKAEQEIVCLDSTVEKLRQLLRRHRDDVYLWPDAKNIWNEVVYDKRMDDSDMLWR